MRMSAEVQIFQDLTTTAPPDSGSGAGDANGLITPVDVSGRTTVVFGLTLLQVVLAGTSIVLVAVLCVCCGFYLCRPGNKKKVYRAAANTEVDADAADDEEDASPVSQPL